MSIPVAHRCYFPGHDLRENRGNKSGMLGLSWNYIDLDTPSEFQLDGCFEKRTLKEPESQGCSQAKNWHRHSTRNGLATGASQPERVGNTS
jgi:hypothetical protein